ncbi:hypothetical protein JHL21_07290 [Devosia sp. WQ 349]|uniref:DUF1254 domain-containing protein n=1 Tax=Devosia sp. WQ 349K1 TaxID=2800329 RepID=UPI00190430BB|nr:hypothetical protein [Devosia sp. WQ 349K1]MBK1794303.1 hypothetical protein [Devosia sp. WQ 349K1]
MIRSFLWLLGGAILGGIIHIVVILSLPSLAENTSWTRISALDADHKMLVLPAITAGGDNPLQLDPELVYGICKIDINEAPAFVQGTLPDAFWSVAVYNSDGIITYSTTNRDGIGQTVELGMFNSAQTQLLAQQQIEVSPNLLVVEMAHSEAVVVVRAAPPHDVMRPRFEVALAAVSCGPRP